MFSFCSHAMAYFTSKEWLCSSLSYILMMSIASFSSVCPIFIFIFFFFVETSSSRPWQIRGRSWYPSLWFVCSWVARGSKLWCWEASHGCIWRRMQVVTSPLINRCIWIFFNHHVFFFDWPILVRMWYLCTYIVLLVYLCPRMDWQYIFCTFFSITKCGSQPHSDLHCLSIHYCVNTHTHTHKI